MKKIILQLFLICAVFSLHAENGHELWLRKKAAVPVNVIFSGKKTAILDAASQELQQGWQGAAGASLKLTLKKDKAIKADGFRLSQNGVEANTEQGILYGVFELLRCQQTKQSIQNGIFNPSYDHRILNHWDNLNGSVERGYAGQLIFWRQENPFVVTDNDKALWHEYARANASVGINGAVINNVNASQLILSPDYLKRVKAIAEALRPYGVKTYLSIKFTSPALLGGLKTSDPLDPAVIDWWKSKVKEIYSIIPD